MPKALSRGNATWHMVHAALYFRANTGSAWEGVLRRPGTSATTTAPRTSGRRGTRRRASEGRRTGGEERGTATGIGDLLHRGEGTAEPDANSERRSRAVVRWSTFAMTPSVHGAASRVMVCFPHGRRRTARAPRALRSPRT